jgi:hypothetical protein
MSRFEDSWKRISRSRTHAEALWAEVKRLFPQDGYAVEIKKESERTFTANAKFKCPSQDISISLELGEFFYQLRAALDAAVWKAVWILDGTEPPPDANSLEFPIYPLQSKFESAAIHKHSFPQELRDWLGTIQPYSADKLVPDPDAGLNVTLEALHNFARKDRHRRLHVCAAFSKNVSFDIIPLSNKAAVEYVELLPTDFLKGKNAFLRFGVIGPIEELKINLATGFEIDISVDEALSYIPRGLPEELRRFGLATEHVINRFDSVFAKLGY